MTIYDQIFISGVLVQDATSSQIMKTVGENNASSKFNITIDNHDGKNANTFTIGDEVTIFAEKDVNPPTTKIFTGILESTTFPSRELKQKLKLSGRDFTARLVDRSVEPEVYTNLSAGSIVKDIIDKYTDDITFTNVDDTTTTIQRITFNHTPVFDAIRELANLSESTFYIDNDKDLHFKERATESSGKTFDNTNVYNSNIKERRDTVYNEIWVYGDRYLDSFKEEFVANGGSVFNLTYKPHNTEVNIGSPITQFTRQKGGIEAMQSVPESGVNYLVNFQESEISFVSGTTLGYSSIPVSGVDLVTIDYKRSLPIVKVGTNQDSVKAFGKRVLKILDKSIKDPNTAQERLVSELAEKSTPKKDGTINVIGVIDVIPSQTAIINLPHQDVDNQVYEIVQATYNFNKFNNQSEKVLQIKLNKRLTDITDTIKDLISEVRVIQAGDITDADILTRFETTTGSIVLRQSGCVVSTRSIAGDGLVWGNATFGIWGSGLWRDQANQSFVLGNNQAAVLGASKLGTITSSFEVVFSGCYP